MLPKSTKIFVSFHPDDENSVISALEQVEVAGWKRIIIPNKYEHTEAVSELIGQSKMALIFLSKAYTRDDLLMLEEFVYISIVLHTSFLPVWLDNLEDIQTSCDTEVRQLERELLKAKIPNERASAGKTLENRRQLLGALEMLVAKHPGIPVEDLIMGLKSFAPDKPSYTPYETSFHQAPCETYEGDNPYIFISYAREDAELVYPIVKGLFEAGWDVWYDDGVEPTKSFLPVIADHIKRSSLFVLMLTKRCLKRPFILNYELAYAKDRIPIIPVLLDDVKKSAYEKYVCGPVIHKHELLNRLPLVACLPNHGTRCAVLPAFKQNRVDDVPSPPNTQEFEIGAYEGGVAITKYLGNAVHVCIPDTIKIPDGEKEQDAEISHIGSNAFTQSVSDVLPRTSLRSITLPKHLSTIGEGAFFNCTSLTSITLPDGVTRIDRDAFSFCESLTEIDIPQSVSSIGEGAFFGCELLSEVILPEGITSIAFSTFTNCKSLTKIILPKSITEIGDIAFSNCTSLTGITLPESVISIGDAAFSGCTSLCYVVIPEGVTYIAENAFKNCPVKIMSRGSSKDAGLVSQTSRQKQIKNNQRPSALPAIPCCEEKPYALVCCAKEDIDSISRMLIALYWEGFNIRYEETPRPQTIDECVCVVVFFTKHLADASLELISKRDKYSIIQLFPDGNIGLPITIKHKLEASQGILHICSLEPEKKTVAWGKVRESLRDFHCCMHKPRGFQVNEADNAVEIVKFHPTGFPHIIIPKTFFSDEKPVTRIGYAAFEQCSSLKEITLPESVTDIGDYAFAKTSLTSVTLPKNVVRIGESAFWCCNSLTEITIPAGVTIIGECAFRGCRSLKSIILPDGITDIGQGFFDGCIMLNNIIIPDKVTNIGNKAFQNCIFLFSATIPMNVLNIGYDVFKGCHLLTIHTPRGSAAWRYAEKNGIMHDESYSYHMKGFSHEKKKVYDNYLHLKLKDKANFDRIVGELLKSCPLPKEKAMEEATLYNMLANYNISHYDFREGLDWFIKECRIYQDNIAGNYTLAMSKYSQLGWLASYLGYYQIAFEAYNEAYLILKKNVLDGFDGVKKDSITLLKKAMGAKEKADRNRGNEGKYGKLKLSFLRIIVIPVLAVIAKIINLLKLVEKER